MTARFIVGDCLEVIAALPVNSVDLIFSSPPFLALRSYLPAYHPDKCKEIGSEPTPAAFIDALLDVTEALDRVLAPHGSLCFELGDTYSGSGGAGGDYDGDGLRDGQPKFRAARVTQTFRQATEDDYHANQQGQVLVSGGSGWPMPKSLSLIPESYRWALAYGRNPFNGRETPPGGCETLCAGIGLIRR